VESGGAVGVVAGPIVLIRGHLRAPIERAETNQSIRTRQQWRRYVIRRSIAKLPGRLLGRVMAYFSIWRAFPISMTECQQAVFVNIVNVSAILLA
jgi:hypothetical protein